MNGLLKFITCGSVDDGKSTLIGHLLYDAKLLFADQKEALILDSKVGSNGGDIDYSLLLDGLAAEREQGITIDVAYRYFTTENRSFIVADTPGHEEYTRNMAVGASFAELAVILVDASKGVLLQTKRHTRICALMGIKHFVFAVNKMDLVGYEESTFKEIAKDIKILIAEFEYESLQIIPVSATKGDNITAISKNIPWYKGEFLLEYLENIEADKAKVHRDFVMPVQRVCRPDSTYRGFQGQIESGGIQVGDQVSILPSGETAAVRSILSGDVEINKGVSGQAVSIQLDREIDISRGCVLAKSSKLFIGSAMRVKLLWMDDAELLAGKNYFLKVGTQKITATVTNVRYKIDVNEGEKVVTDVIRKNELAVCDIITSGKIVFDSFSNNQVLGGLILIDRVSHMTSACGIVLHSLSRGENLIPYEMEIGRRLRENQKGQKARTIWFTGLSGSGKSTLANEIEKTLFSEGMHTMSLDGDSIRQGLNKNLGFKETDRIENIRRVAEVAKLMNDAGLIVIASFVSPFESDRRNVAEIVGPNNFIEVYVNTPLAECERRDVKGLYEKARNGEIPNFTGVTSPYETPSNPDIIIDTTNAELAKCVERIMDKLRQLLQ